jgi:hypothetical protein
MQDAVVVGILWEDVVINCTMPINQIILAVKNAARYYRLVTDIIKYN